MNCIIEVRLKENAESPTQRVTTNKRLILLLYPSVTIVFSNSALLDPCYSSSTRTATTSVCRHHILASSPRST